MTDPVRLGLLSAYRKLMQPLVRILVRNGVSFGELGEVLKNVFVEVAERDFDVPGRRTSQSRVAILTGLPRARKSPSKKQSSTAGATGNVVTNLNPVTRVLVGWHHRSQTLLDHMECPLNYPSNHQSRLVSPIWFGDTVEIWLLVRCSTSCCVLRQLKG